MNVYKNLVEFLMEKLKKKNIIMKKENNIQKNTIRKCLGFTINLFVEFKVFLHPLFSILFGFSSHYIEYNR